MADILSALGEPEEAWSEIREYRAREPFPPRRSQLVIGQVLYQLGRYAEAISVFEAVVALSPYAHNYESRLMLIACYSAMEDPRAPEMAKDYWVSHEFIIEERMLWKSKTQIDRLLADLARAGLE